MRRDDLEESLARKTLHGCVDPGGSESNHCEHHRERERRQDGAGLEILEQRSAGTPPQCVVQTERHRACNHQDSRSELEYGGVVVAETCRLWSESAGIEGGEEDHQCVEEGAFPFEPEYLVGDHPEHEDAHNEMNERYCPDETCRGTDGRQDSFVSCFSVVQGETASPCEEHQCCDDDSLSTEEVEQMAPEVQRGCHVIEVLDEGEPCRRQAGHRIEYRIDRASVVAGEDEGNRSDHRHGQPGQRNDHHAVAPVETFVRRSIPQSELPEEGEGPDHQQERCERVPLAAQDGPGKWYKARHGDDGEDPSERVCNDPQVLAIWLDQHVRSLR